MTTASRPQAPAAPHHDQAFGRSEPFTIGIEEGLLVVRDADHALDPRAEEFVRALGEKAALTHTDLYAALLELASPVCRTPAEAVADLRRLRAAAVALGAHLLGAGIHPAQPFGHVQHVDDERYRQIAHDMRGLVARTPTCALHVHIGMPDASTAIRVTNGLRDHLPLLQALSANSPFWHGIDSGLASARAALFRSAPRSEIPRAFADWDDYLAAVAAILSAGALPDYTLLWWDVRPHPRLGTVEVRAMDAQSSSRAVLALAALVQALAAYEADRPPRPWTPREALMESSFRAARDGVQATLLHNETLRPVGEIATEFSSKCARMHRHYRLRPRSTRCNGSSPPEAARHASAARSRAGECRACSSSSSPRPASAKRCGQRGSARVLAAIA